MTGRIGMAGQAIESVIGWLDSHIDYERTGPGDNRSSRHDPELRMQRVRRFLDLLDNPQRSFETIHLTGTNGKTSTSRAITQLLLAQGLRTGTFTSPHLERINERIEINGEPIDDDDLADVLESIRLIETLIPHVDTPSYFEVLTAAAFRCFADAPVDVGVIEVGVGGLYDSTNIIDSDVCVITNIDHDHHNYLGSTLADIAFQKAGIIKPGATVVTGVDDGELLSIIEARNPAKLLVRGRDYEVESNQVAVGGRLVTIRTPHATYQDVFVRAHGAHQGDNAASAIVAVEALFDAALHRDVVGIAFETLSTPGRFEIVGNAPVLVLDGAHNPAGAQRLVETLDEEIFADGQVLVVGMLEPRDPVEMFRALRVERSSLVIVCEVDSPRAIPVSELAGAARGLNAAVVEADSVADAIARARQAAGDDGMVVVTGSLYVVGAARALI